MNVTRTDIRVRSIDPQAPGLIRVYVTVSPTPDAYWREIFGDPNSHLPPGYSQSISMHGARFDGAATILLSPPDGQVHTYIQKLDERMAATNEAYAREIVPILERDRKAKAEAEATERARLEAAQREADSI